MFGNSSGAMIGLELAARHPEHVRTLVAHEPPIFDVRPERDHWRAVMRNVEDTFRKEGAGPAGQVLTAALQMSGGGQDDDRTDPETLAAMGRMEKNMEFFIGYEVPPFASPRFRDRQRMS